MQLYLQNVHGLAGILVPASFCRTVSILCFWPGCGGAVRTQWTTGPAPIKTPCQTKWRCRLPRHPKYVYTPPPGQISTHTAAPHTMTTLHMQPETEKRKRKMNVNWRFNIYHDMTVIAESSLKTNYKSYVGEQLFYSYLQQPFKKNIRHSICLNVCSISYMEYWQQASMAGCWQRLKLSPDGGVEGINRD